MKKLLMTAALLVLGVAPARADVTVGLVLPLTGRQANLGEQIRHGADQAVLDINARGGIAGEKLVLRQVDDACDPRQAVAVANQMASGGVKFVVGASCSGAAIAASKVFMEEGILSIAPLATNPKLTDEGKDIVFRNCGRDDQQGAVLGNYMIKHFGDKKIAVAHDNSAYGKGLAEEILKTLRAGGVKEVLFDTYTPGERDYAALVSKLKQVGAQVLMVGGFQTEIGLIARQIKEQGATIQILGGDALMTSEFWTIAGTTGEGVLMSFNPDPRRRAEAKDVIAAIRKTGYEPEGYTLYTYAAFQALAEGIARAGKTDTMKVAAALRASPVPTVLGNLNFDAKGDVTGENYVLYRWHDGSYAEVTETLDRKGK